jgi:hypothetical protein
VTVLSAGALAAFAVVLGIGPFGRPQALLASVLHRESPATLTAQSVFPTVQPIQQVVDVYDPAPPGSVRSAAPAAPPAATLASAPLPPAGKPSQNTGPYPVINFPAGPMSAIEATCEAAKQAAENKGSAYQQNVERQCEAAKQAYERAHP